MITLLHGCVRACAFIEYNSGVMFCMYAYVSYDNNRVFDK